MLKAIVMEIVKGTTNKPLRQLHKAEEACQHGLNNVVYDDACLHSRFSVLFTLAIRRYNK